MIYLSALYFPPKPDFAQCLPLFWEVPYVIKNGIIYFIVIKVSNRKASVIPCLLVKIMCVGLVVFAEESKTVLENYCLALFCKEWHSHTKFS